MFLHTQRDHLGCEPAGKNEAQSFRTHNRNRTQEHVVEDGMLPTRPLVFQEPSTI